MKYSLLVEVLNLRKLNNFSKLSTLAVIILIFAGCGANQPWYGKRELAWTLSVPDTTAKIIQKVFLIGDCGKAIADPLNPALCLLRSQLEKADENTTLVYLGDNIYEFGLLPENHPERKESENHLNAQLALAKAFPGRTMVVPGNHDWNRSKTGGWEAVKRQQAYVEAQLGAESFLPQGGCPGPVLVPLGENVLMMVIDSEWWLHKSKDKPNGPNSDCETKNDKAFITGFFKTLLDHPDHHILVVAHHPVYSNGNHGGKFSAGTHFVPVFGSLYALLRQFVTRQDIQHPRNKRYRSIMRSGAKLHNKFVYVSGHEHSLQYFEKPDGHFIVSGAGTKNSYVEKGHGAGFAHRENGFAILNYYDNGDAWLEVWEPVLDGSSGILVYRRWLGESNGRQR